jgi:hypothetical protein
MNNPAKSAYHNSTDQNEEVCILFDFRIPRAGCKMRRHKFAWKSYATIERLDEHHAVLIVRPGGAREITR